MNSKQTRTKSGNSPAALLLGILIILTGYAAWGMMTISYKAYIYKEISILFTCIAAAMYFVLVIITDGIKRSSEKKQLKVVSCVGFVISALLLFRAPNGFALIGIWVITFGISFVYEVISERGVSRQFLTIKVLKGHAAIMTVIMITCLLLFDSDAVQAKWDGLLYYLACTELDIGSLSNLAVYGHVAQTYGMLNGMCNLIIDNAFVVMVGLNIFLMLSSILGFYMLLKEMVPNKKETQYAIASAVYAWSPFLLGMVYYHSLDFYCGCLFVWVLYFFYKYKWVYFIIFSLLFCFTKEPAIVIYAAMCAGIVLYDIVNDDGYSFFKRVQRCFIRKQYYLMVLPGILWLATYKILGPWSAGNGGFSIEAGYVWEKLKNLYLLNFNWLFTLFAVGGSIWILVKQKEKHMFGFLFPIWCSQIAFTLFSCLFKTVNHPRYNDTNQVTLYLLAIIPLLIYCEEKKYKVIVGILSILCLTSSYVTFDPVSRNVYDEVDIGGATMIYTSAEPLGDGMIYNRQMLGFETALCGALQEAIEDRDAILFPTVDNNAYAFDGMAEVGVISGGYRIENEFWEDADRKRVPEKKDSTRTFQIYQLTDNVNWKELEQKISGRVSYLCIPGVCDLYGGYIREHYQILEEKEYEHRGWVVKKVCFMM